MARRPPADDVDDLEADDEPRRRHRTRRRSEDDERRLAPWDSGAEDDPTSEPGDREPGLLHRARRPVYFRATDSIWFEPLVALMIIVLLLVSLWAYTANWPPIYVVESPSMQHGTVDVPGLINTGDLVLAKQTSWDQVTTYESGAQTGYSTYGEFGDVILYHPSGIAGPVPIIHRAILYIVANPDGSYSFPSLQGQPCGAGPASVYSLSTGTGCGTSHVVGTLTLHHVGWQSVDVQIPLGQMGHSSGFVTMGDNNYASGTPGAGFIDQPARGGLVSPSWIVGVARGMLPWFGAVKLALEGQAQDVPSASWAFMGITLAAVVLLAFGIHYAFRPRRPGGSGAEGEDDVESGRPRRRASGFWRRSPRDGDADDEGSVEGGRPPGGDADWQPRPRGRPRPEVRPWRRRRSRRRDREPDEGSDE